MPGYLERHPGYEPLQAAVSVLALDIGDVELARSCARQAADHPDAMATLASLDLAENRFEEARDRFERSIALNAENGRARVGLGLTELAAGEAASAARHLDLGAELFADHLGSWIAAGWAHYLADNPAAARERFERALALDSTFGDAHGSLAALDALEGHLEPAKRSLEVARRLDRESFSAGLAEFLLASAANDPDNARKIFEHLTSRPINHRGQTLTQALAQLQGEGRRTGISE